MRTRTEPDGYWDWERRSAPTPAVKLARTGVRDSEYEIVLDGDVVGTVYKFRRGLRGSAPEWVVRNVHHQIVDRDRTRERVLRRALATVEIGAVR